MNHGVAATVAVPPFLSLFQDSWTRRLSCPSVCNTDHESANHRFTTPGCCQTF